MIGYFPKPYKNETIYSIAARYSYHYGIKSKYEITQELFDTKILSVNPEYIHKIANLALKINYFSREYTESYFIQNHTTVPIYAPFKTSNNNSDELNNIYGRRKVTYVDIPSKEHLYFCAECLKEQFETYGEGFWHRLFQVPGVFVCTKHKRCLNYFHINVVRELNYRFEIPKYDLIFTPETQIKEDVFNKLLNLSLNIEYFFNNQIMNMEIHDLYDKYLEYAKILGLAIPMSKLKDRLNNLMIITFGEEVLNLLNSSSNVFNWIDRFFSRKGLKNVHPIRHVLLMIALAGSVKEFIESKPIFKPFGEGPWVCMNPLSNHYLENVVTSYKISIHGSNRGYQADFICDCGYIYRLRFGEKHPLNVKYFSNRIMKKGIVWEREFQKLREEGVTINQLAEKTHLSRPTIRKIINEGVDPIINGIRKKEKIKSEERKQKTKEYRIIWKCIRENNPEFSRKDLADLNRAVYCWLHQFDKEWLDKNSPPSKIGSHKLSEEYYIQKDIVLVKEAKKLFNNWRLIEEQNGKLIRKSYNAFCKRLKATSNLITTKEKYPLTVTYIRTVEESIADFQIRKLEYTLKANFEGINVSKNSLTRKTGIRRWKNETENYLEDLVKKHNEKISKKN